MSTEWPKHEDGTNKTVGEMTAEEKRAVFLSVADQYAERGDAFAAAHFRRLADRATA
jgi:hypothetical protein